MSVLASFTSSDKELLKLSPFWVFHLVSSADGKIDEKELKQFKNDLTKFTTTLFTDEELSTQRLDAEVAITILESVSSNFEELQQTFNKYSNVYLEHLGRVATLIDSQFNKNEAKLFKHILVNLAINIADSSGGWKFLKNNISQLEAIAIEKIKHAIRYTD